MAWHIYKIVPIDSRWEHLNTVTDTRAKLARTEVEGLVLSRHIELSVDSFDESWAEVRQLARTVGWEGDFRGDPVAFWLPTGETFTYAFAWKQSHNGTTFVATPYRLQYLDGLQE